MADATLHQMRRKKLVTKFRGRWYRLLWELHPAQTVVVRDNDCRKRGCPDHT